VPSQAKGKAGRLNEKGMDLVHMGTSAPITFKILKILKSHTSIFSKIMTLNT
jgi:hypothetical protein